MKKNAFTLLELLVVIAVIGVLVAVILPNLVGVRARARDSALKNNLRQLKTALRMYYNDHQAYPNDDGAGNIVACGATGSSVCPETEGSFSTGDMVYMKEMPTSEEYSYDSSADGEDFILSTVLENASDADIADSVEYCRIENPVVANYYVCAD